MRKGCSKECPFHSRKNFSKNLKKVLTDCVLYDTMNMHRNGETGRNAKYS